MRGGRILGLKKYQGRNPHGYFQDLSWEAQRRARKWLWLWCQKWGRKLPQWRFAILVGQAKRLAINPPTTAWGRSMLAKKGGYAVQRSYRMEAQLHPGKRALAEQTRRPGHQAVTWLGYAVTSHSSQGQTAEPRPHSRGYGKKPAARKLRDGLCRCLTRTVRRANLHE